MAGMTDANMQMVTIKVTLDGELEHPEQKLDSGEFIVKRIVALDKLNDELKGLFFIQLMITITQPLI
jgi:ADP-ribose pyrophosphatase